MFEFGKYFMEEQEVPWWDFNLKLSTTKILDAALPRMTRVLNLARVEELNGRTPCVSSFCCLTALLRLNGLKCFSTL